MKNVLIIDGTENATFNIFRATEEEFDYLFPAPGQDIETIENFFGRQGAPSANAILRALWERPIPKNLANGIHGTLLYNHADKRHYLPSTKREIDRDAPQTNRAQRDLYATLQGGEGQLRHYPRLTLPQIIDEIAGGSELVAWFDGRVPSFHDAEIVGLSLETLEAVCSLSIRAFRMTSDLDANGQFVLDKSVAVVFRMEGVTRLELQDFNTQNVIQGLSISKTPGELFCLELHPCYGMAGIVEAERLRISLLSDNR